MAGLKGKTGIVTGGSSGIGFQIANVLAQAGATVYVISRTGKPKEGVGESAPGVVHLQGDIGNAEAMKTLVTELAAKHNGCLDFLVNNAGVSYKCRAEDFPMEQFDNIMNVNVKYLFQMSVICYPYLKKSADKGRIINITSMSAHLGFSEVVPYCTSKGAVLAMIVAAAFPLLYSYAVEITRSIGEMVLMPFLEQQEEGSGFNLVLSLIGQAAQTASVAMALGFVVYTVVLVCAYVQMVFRGIELLVYRLGVPLAVVGFIDSDDGVWKGYIQALFRQLATVLVCYVLTMLGMAVMSSLGWLNLIVGIALEFAAFKAPKMLSQFLIPSGGGGGKMQIVYTAARAFLGG